MRRLLISIFAAISLLTQPVFASSFTNTNIGTGTVTTVGVTTANGVSGSVANPTTAPAITISLGAITPSSVAASGTVTGSNLSGTNTGDQTTVSGQAGSVANAVTFDNSGSGAASGTTFNGSAARTVSTNTIGALKASNNLSDVASIPTTALNIQGGYVVCQNAVAVSTPNDTTADTTDTCTIPAGAMGANGRVVVDVLFTTTSSANVKTFGIKFGATNYWNVGATTTASHRINVFIANRNATGSQVGSAGGPVTSFGDTSTAVTTSAIDTTASVNLTITCTKALGSETCTREAYQVLLYPKG